MNLKKIGEFIAQNRKAKKLTQEQLAEKLGVTNKTVSRWENGNYMPDMSLLKLLSEELGITINELLSGERITEEKVIEKTETSIINTINYTERRLEKEHKKISIGIMIIGIIISISALTIFETESSWSSIYSIIGIIIFITGLAREIKYRRILISSILFIAILGLFYGIDYVGVKVNNRPPIYRHITHTRLEQLTKIGYYTLFYNVYRINPNTPNEYYIVDEEKQYNIDTVPISPFNRNKSGIDNIIKYENKYVGNNSNVGNLLYNLPLSEYEFVFEIDTKDLGITIDYHTTDWYNNEQLYIQKCLIYNSVSIFALIDNVKYIQYNFSGSSYKITRNQVENYYPNYVKIKENSINKTNFNLYLEEKMNDYHFIQKQYQQMFEKGI